MGSFFHSYTYSLPFLFLSLLIFKSCAQSHDTPTRNNSNGRTNISAVIVFGDSTVDPGNNNYIKTAFRSDFAPYGRDFANHLPSGRFTNGRLVTDFAASYAGIKEYVPPYLDPTLTMEELMTGVSFASAASGFDPLTPKITNVVSMAEQVEQFKEYKTRVGSAIGEERTENLINKAVFIISAGTNDFVITYFGSPILRQYDYPISSYYQFLLQHIQLFLQDLMELGARRIVMVGTPPIGCLPLVITLNSNHVDRFLKRDCIARMSSVTLNFNQILQQKLRDMQIISDTTKFYYADIYKPINDLVQHPKKFGFDEVDTGCCGSGLLEASLLCNPKSKVCSDASRYVFWDSIHPTERTYLLIFKALSPIMDLILQGN